MINRVKRLFHPPPPTAEPEPCNPSLFEEQFNQTFSLLYRLVVDLEDLRCEESLEGYLSGCLLERRDKLQSQFVACQLEIEKIKVMATLSTSPLHKQIANELYHYFSAAVCALAEEGHPKEVREQLEGMCETASLDRSLLEVEAHRVRHIEEVAVIENWQAMDAKFNMCLEDVHNGVQRLQDLALQMEAKNSRVAKATKTQIKTADALEGNINSTVGKVLKYKHTTLKCVKVNLCLIIVALVVGIAVWYMLE
ncbi:MAG: hypothetical protein KVP17_001039 [Porospora cf. gigantea B]|uniref:uncharacterized protein n=1 Tax=Porospora cf. gigantea B TaxID=2853592 RepID=UPI0035717C26|nr:MAG: hypothetical protein KVP17_001039 [Porospora cf. gigantea B]